MIPNLSGRKTYIAAALTVAGFWGAYLSGDMPLVDAIEMTAEAAMVIFLRLGIAKGATPLPDSKE